MSIQSHKPPIDDNRDTSRLEAFSDGVIAIAITLLVLDIKVPRTTDIAAGTTLLKVLLRQWPSYLSFFISFVVIAIFWANHHNMFRYIKRSNHILLLINTLFLMSVVLIPFSTALLAEYLQQSERQTATLIYIGTLTVAGGFFNLVWWYATSHKRLIDRNTDSRLLSVNAKRYLLGLAIYLLSFSLAFFSVTASLALFIIVPVFFALPGPDERSV